MRVARVDALRARYPAWRKRGEGMREGWREGAGDPPHYLSGKPRAGGGSPRGRGGIICYCLPIIWPYVYNVHLWANMSANDEYNRYLALIMKGDVYYMSFTQDRRRCPDTNITDSFESTHTRDILNFFSPMPFHRTQKTLDFQGSAPSHLSS